MQLTKTGMDRLQILTEKHMRILPDVRRFKEAVYLDIENQSPNASEKTLEAVETELDVFAEAE